MILQAVEGPEEDREDRRRGPTYVTGKQALCWSGMLAVLIAIGYFTIFKSLKENRDFVVSKNHLQDIYRALFQYANDNSEGLPALYLQGVKDAEGNPVTWANQLFQYTKDFGIYENPSNPGSGNTPLTTTNAKGERLPVPLSYGLLSSVDVLRRYEIRDDTRILGETIGRGVSGSYNPIPLGGADGFVIGYDNSNLVPDAQSHWVTRLAFTDGFEPVHRGRGVAVLTANGSIQVLSGREATAVAKRGKVPFGPWVP